MALKAKHHWRTCCSTTQSNLKICQHLSTLSGFMQLPSLLHPFELLSLLIQVSISTLSISAETLPSELQVFSLHWCHEGRCPTLASWRLGTAAALLQPEAKGRGFRTTCGAPLPASPGTAGAAGSGGSGSVAWVVDDLSHWRSDHRIAGIRRWTSRMWVDRRMRRPTAWTTKGGPKHFLRHV